MRQNVKPKELESQNPDIDKKYINHVIEDTRAYATYVGVDTSKWDDFYCFIFNFYRTLPNYEFYAVYVDDDKAYLLYSKYEEFRPVYKLLMNVNKKDNTCVYDYFKKKKKKKCFDAPKKNIDYLKQVVKNYKNWGYKGVVVDCFGNYIKFGILSFFILVLGMF